MSSTAFEPTNNSDNRFSLSKEKKHRSALILTLLLSLTAILALCLGGCRKGPKPPALFDDTLEKVDPDPDVHVRITAAGEPNIIYAPPVDVAGYRYGPTIMYYADGTSDAWFSTNGYGGEWDWISLKHSDDAVTFGGEKVVLVPCADSMDKFSCCDPGIVYFGGYYYLGYTSTIVSTNGGVNNNVFVARSKTPDGPYEKWNGSGWGGDPAPIVYYDEYDLKYGAGEPSMVVVDDVLYVYYTWICPEGSFEYLAISDTAEDWPARLEFKGEVYARHDSQDSFDAAYLEDAGKFIALCTQNRFSEQSGIALLESEDGLTFRQTGLLRAGLYQYSHNMGVARRPDGHIQLKDPVFIGYAFSDGADGNWGKWATAFQPVKLELYRGEPEAIDPDERGILKEGYLQERDPDPPMIGIAPNVKIVEIQKDESYGTVSFVWLDPMLGAHALNDVKKVKYSGFDTSLISIKGNRIYPKGKTGETRVIARYGRFENEFKVYVRENFYEFQGAQPRTVVEFTPVIAEYTLSLSDRHIQQIRGLARFSDNTWGEVYNEGKMISAVNFPVTYEVSDPEVIKVNQRGLIYPLSPGTAEVSVTIAGGKSFTVKVTVVD